MPIDHDQIFKQLIEAFIREFMELFRPDEAALIDFSRLEFLGEEHFTDSSRGLSRFLDLVVKAGMKSGGERFVLVHGEFEASRKAGAFPRRMYRYHCQLFLRYDTEIVPIAVFSDDARWKKPVPDHFELAVSDNIFVRFDYHLIKLRHLDYRQFLDTNNPLAYALMAKMDYDRKQRVRLKADFLRLILGCPLVPARRSLLIEHGLFRFDLKLAVLDAKALDQHVGDQHGQQQAHNRRQHRQAQRPEDLEGLGDLRQIPEDQQCAHHGE